MQTERHTGVFQVVGMSVGLAYYLCFVDGKGCSGFGLGCFNGPVDVGRNVPNPLRNKKWRPTCGETFSVKVVEGFQGNSGLFVRKHALIILSTITY